MAQAGCVTCGDKTERTDFDGDIMPQLDTVPQPGIGDTGFLTAEVAQLEVQRDAAFLVDADGEPNLLDDFVAFVQDNPLMVALFTVLLTRWASR